MHIIQQQQPAAAGAQLNRRSSGIHVDELSTARRDDRLQKLLLLCMIVSGMKIS